MNNAEVNKAAILIRSYHARKRHALSHSNFSSNSGADSFSRQNKIKPAEKKNPISLLAASVAGLITGGAFGILRQATFPKEVNIKLTEEIQKDPQKKKALIQNIGNNIEKVNRTKITDVLKSVNLESEKPALLNFETEKKRLEDRIKSISSGELDADYRANKIKVGEDGRPTPNFMTDKKGNPLTEAEIAQKLERAKHRALYILNERKRDHNLQSYIDIENGKIIEKAKNASKINLGELAKDEKGLAEAKQLLMKSLDGFSSEEIVKLNQKIIKELAMSGKKAALAGFILGSLGYIAAKLTFAKPETKNFNKVS